jgi:hypothetical protein
MIFLLPPVRSQAQWHVYRGSSPTFLHLWEVRKTLSHRELSGGTVGLLSGPDLAWQRSSSIPPTGDTAAGENYARNGKPPIFWWE